MLSALITVPSNVSASAKAKADFPLALGPATTTMDGGACSLMGLLLACGRGWRSRAGVAIDARVPDATTARRSEAMLQTYEGGCHCGRVRFRISADLATTTYCNCSICT